MKYTLRTGKIQDIEKAESKGLAVAYRSGKSIRLLNLECLPEKAFVLENDPKTNDLVIRVKLNEGDFFVIESTTGDAEKRTL